MKRIFVILIGILSVLNAAGQNAGEVGDQNGGLSPAESLAFSAQKVASDGQFSSKDSTKIARINRSDKGESLIVAGPEGATEGVPYESIRDFVFSPSGNHYGFEAKKGDKWMAVVDGSEGAGYDEIYPIIFSADGKRSAYRAREGDKEIMVVDGVKNGPYGRSDDPIFSLDGQHVAYNIFEDGVPYVIVDGTKLETKGSGVVFSPDGSRWAYSSVNAYVGDPVYVVLDGRVINLEGSRVLGLYFSPEGSRFAYNLAISAGQRIVVDDQSGKDYLEARNVVFSPDGSQAAYAARDGAGVFVVHNEEEGKRYQDVSDIVFSPDGGHMAYRAVENGRELVVLDGSEGNDHNNVWGLVFSSGGRLAYAARDYPSAAGKDVQLVVLDGKEGLPFAKDWAGQGILSGPVFSPDGSHVIYMANDGGKAEFLVVDHTTRINPWILFSGSAPVFDSPSTFHYLGRNESGIYLVNVAVPAEEMAAEECSWTGIWDTNLGLMDLTESGKKAGGLIVNAYGTGRIAADLDGKRLTGTIARLPTYKPPDVDSFDINMSEDCQNFTGFSRNGLEGPWSFEWKGRRAYEVSARPKTKGAEPETPSNISANGSMIQTSEWGVVSANQVLVALKDGKGRSDADRVAESLGGEVVGVFEYINLYKINISSSSEAELSAAIAKAKQDPDVELVFPNQQVYPYTDVRGVQCSPLDDPVYTEAGRGKGYEMIGVQNAWDLIRVSGLPLSDVHVGVVDDGLYKGNEEFSDKVKIDTSEPNSELNVAKYPTIETEKYGSHGTSIMNIIAADPDNGGIAGIASGALKDKLTASMVNTFAPPYHGKVFGSLEAINKSIEKGAKVISISWGAKDDISTPEATAAAYKKFFKKMARDHPDVLFVCAAGNEHKAIDGSRYYPAGLDLPNMITVGNVMNNGPTASSNMINNEKDKKFEVTLAAPGEESVWGFSNMGLIGNSLGGTSMAAPQVSSAAAILKSLKPSLNAGQIKEILVNSARTSVKIDGKDVPAPPDLGGRILAIDQAVLKVINDQRNESGLPSLKMEEALASARIGLSAKNDPEDPKEWKVTADVLGVGPGGVDVVLELQGEGAVGDARKHLSQSGTLTWDVTVKDTATVVVKRLDTNGCSRAFLAEGGEKTLRLIGTVVKEGKAQELIQVFTGGPLEPVANVQVELVFTYLPVEYAANTPSSTTATTDQDGKYEFEVPQGSQFKIIINGKEYTPEVHEGRIRTIDITSPGEVIEGSLPQGASIGPREG